MKFITRTFAALLLLAAGVSARSGDPDITGRWTGTADTTDEAGAKVNAYVYLDFEVGEPLRWSLN